jgi:phosphatidylinositol glycan class V
MSLWKAILGFLHCSLLALMIVLPVVWHDASGYERHCHHISTEDKDHVVRPSWCRRDLENADEHFSLYGHVQLVHWNVGIFRYYQWKQIPNFLLAAPILILSFTAVVHWIMASWERYHLNTSTDISSYPEKVVRWAIASMEDAVPETKHERRSIATNAKMVSGRYFYQELLMGPLMLNHYAVLAAVSMIGLLIAHIQISTRLICSSCPAIYWFMALCFLGRQEETGSRILSFMGKCITRYCVLYILLGAILHSNWLPWT